MLYWQIRSGEEPRIACDGCMVVGLRMLCATRGPLEHSGCALAFCCRDTLPLLGNSIIPAAMLWTLAKNMQQLHAVIDGWLIIVESENLVGQWATPHRRLNLEVPTCRNDQGKKSVMRFHLLKDPGFRWLSYICWSYFPARAECVWTLDASQAASVLHAVVALGRCMCWEWIYGMLRFILNHFDFFNLDDSFQSNHTESGLSHALVLWFSG